MLICGKNIGIISSITTLLLSTSIMSQDENILMKRSAPSTKNSSPQIHFSVSSPMSEISKLEKTSRRIKRSNSLDSLNESSSDLTMDGGIGFGSSETAGEMASNLRSYPSISTRLRDRAAKLDLLKRRDPAVYDEYSKIIRRLETRQYLPWLSFTGGGTRGIIGAKFLEIFEEKTGKQVKDLCPFMAGTSTGALLATLFTLGVPAKEVVSMYKEFASSIFEAQFYFNPAGVRGPKYYIENLQNIIREYVGDKRLAEVEGDLLITAYNASRKRTQVFKSWEARNNPEDRKKNPKLVKLLAASAAAPTYFDPVVINGEAYVDGGLFANDPAACALAEIKNRYGKVNHMAILLGTGDVDRGFTDPYDLIGRGSLAQVKDIIDYSISANVDTSRYFVRQFLPNIGQFQQLYIVNPAISEEFAEMDSTDPRIIHRLELYAEEYVDAEKDKTWIKNLVKEILIKNKMDKIARPKEAYTGIEKQESDFSSPRNLDV